MSTSEPRNTFERALARRAQEANADEFRRALEILSGDKPFAGGRHGRRRRRLIFGGVALLLAVMSVSAARALVSGGGRRGSEPIGAVATAEGAGIGTSVAGFLPVLDTQPVASPSPAPTPAPAVEPAPQPAPTPRPRRTARRRAAPAPEPAAATPPDTVAATPPDTVSPSAVAVATVAPAPAPTPPPPPAPAVLNIGTRIAATLEAPVRTGATLTPATALVSADVTVGERVILPAGARLVGSAFATTGDDRVQLLWRAVVVGGRTHRLDGEALSSDGAQGLQGKVVKKKGKRVLRRIGGALLGTAGETLGYGIPGGEGVTGLAEDALMARAGRELQRAAQDHEWLQADKVIALPAGAALVVYLSADVVITEPGR